MNFPVRNNKSKKLQKETNNKFPNSPKPKSKSKSKARKNPLRQGVVYNSLSDLLKNFAIKKRNTPELFKNNKNKVKK
tara:strand:+ start:881 stop:1111 length:231 start_codon:yes stop_codon:yes gene_type:complete